MCFYFSSMNIQELPKEMITSILKYLDGQSLYECTKVSQRFREIGRNKFFWQNIKVLPELHHVTKDYHSVYYPIPIHFLQFVIENGCKFLDLKICEHQIKKDYSDIPHENDVVYLNLGHPYYETEFEDKNQDIFSELIVRCRSLEKLRMNGISLTNLSIGGIRKHSKTLTHLDLSDCTEAKSELFRELIINCDELVEANFCNLALDDKDVQVIGTHLSSKIVRLSLKGLWEFSDENIQTLVRRCNKIEELHFRNTSITEIGVKDIIEHLSNLTKVALSDGIDAKKCMGLGTMPNLKFLWSFPFMGYDEYKQGEYFANNPEDFLEKDMELEELFPHLTINCDESDGPTFSKDFRRFSSTQKEYVLKPKIIQQNQNRMKKLKMSKF